MFSTALIYYHYSLGAHIAGLAGKNLRNINKSNKQIACIIGLDPASVGFSMLNPVERLTNLAAGYVQVIHTDTSKFGASYPMGHGTRF